MAALAVTKSKRRDLGGRGVEPPVEPLLEVSDEHRARAEGRDLSNTARAHELGRIGDWMVICFYDSDHRERQRTVVTETRGSLVGRRVVRGREQECPAWYD